ncbi:MAG: hypothetical protein OJF59_000831 [Cytophagales bacterium]|jgi:hypothetical protein|nr:MAG: hypothetical protein OJF59_000831 [Cytophagales bacterium]
MRVGLALAIALDEGRFHAAMVCAKSVAENVSRLSNGGMSDTLYCRVSVILSLSFLSSPSFDFVFVGCVPH